MGCVASSPMQALPVTTTEERDVTAHVRGDFRHELVWERTERRFEEVYECKGELGSGAMGTIVLASKRPEANLSVYRSPSHNSLVPLGESSSLNKSPPHLYAAKLIEFQQCNHAHKVKKNKMPRAKSYPHLRAERLEELRHEIDVLRRLDHPNVVHLREAFWEETRLVLVLELLEGAMLSRLCGRIDELTVAQCAEQLMRAVSYLHDNAIVHRDLKLDNVMACGEEAWRLARTRAKPRVEGRARLQGLSVKLIDFGLSRPTMSRKEEEEWCGPKRVAAAGTLSTAAPEVARGGEYSTAADVWSCGACFYRLIANENPFLDDYLPPTAEDLARLDRASIPWKPQQVFKATSREGRGFIYKCMRSKLTSRWSSHEASVYVHQTWLPALPPDEHEPTRMPSSLSAPSLLASSRIVTRSNSSSSSSSSGSLSSCNSHLTPEMQASMLKYARYSDLKRAALMVAAHEADHRHTERVRLAFNEIDTEGRGVVTVEELRAAFRFDDDRELSELFEKLDSDKAGVVHYHEFLAAALESQPELLDEEAIEDTFERLDSRNTGVIDEDNLRAILGSRATDDLIHSMMNQCEHKHGGIDFDEFTRLIRDDEKQDQPRQEKDALRHENGEQAKPLVVLEA